MAVFWDVAKCGYLKENTTFHHYKDKLIKVVQGNNRCLHRDSYKTHKYRIHKYLLVKQVVYIVTC
jgi:hypothetical protein